MTATLVRPDLWTTTPTPMPPSTLLYGGSGNQSAGAYPAFGSWGIVTTLTPAILYIFQVGVMSSSNNGIVQLGVGAVGAEQPIASFMSIATMDCFNLPYLIEIPAGARLSLRVAASSGFQGRILYNAYRADGAGPPPGMGIAAPNGYVALGNARSSPTAGIWSNMIQTGATVLPYPVGITGISFGADSYDLGYASSGTVVPDGHIGTLYGNSTLPPSIMNFDNPFVIPAGKIPIIFPGSASSTFTICGYRMDLPVGRT